ncbi:hypothetical protein [Shimia sp. MIT1388]|uniref:hypothetical protein n=1 Tax=Shimia sp. MIT1388 TaxID=3096992 RepID=UPI00399A6D34
MLVIALILFVGPLLGGALSLGAGAQLWRDGKAEGPIAVLLATALGLLAIWGLRYDLGLNLPELSALPSGATLEQTLAILAGALFLTLLVGTFRWPAQRKGRWMAVLACLFWGVVIAAGIVLSGVDFRH